MSDIFAMKGAKKFIARILKAVKNKEKIILWADPDADGICSLVILKEAIEALGGKLASVYFPDIGKEGYGLTKTGLEFLAKFSPALLIILDCGIGNFEEAKQAKKMGFELIIIDHHIVLGKLPEASIIVDPKQKRDKYPFKELATAGITFKLSQLLVKDKALKENLLELVGLATLADRMPEVEENQVFIAKGLANLQETLRPGLQALLKTDFVRDGVSDEDLAWRIISVLNSGRLVRHLDQAYLLLTADSLKKANPLAAKLLEKRKLRQEQIKKIFQEVDQRVADKKQAFIFEGNAWPSYLLGAIASRICEKYEKPTFIFSRGKKESRGSIRALAGFNMVEALNSCSHFLETYGGHELAAGFRLKNENLEKLKTCLKKYFI